jgi:NAD(P)-dependent dehydrogenase (short-subunit alcohol dehydrogenase family)
MPAALVTGANRGLGLEFVRQYAADGWNVVAVCRDPSSASALADIASGNDAVELVPADVVDPDSIVALCERLGNRPLDIVINNAGIFGPSRKAAGDDGQTFGYVDVDSWIDVLRVNTIAPLKIAEALLANVAAAGNGKIVTISSGLGSIAGTEGGYYAYRTSKAAVNMAMATLAKEPAAADVTVCVLNPGWVRTDMGGNSAPLEPGESVAAMRRLIEELDSSDSGSFIDVSGRRIDW